MIENRGSIHPTKRAAIFDSLPASDGGVYESSESLLFADVPGVRRLFFELHLEACY